MKNSHITRFGDPLFGDGALYFVTDENGFEQMIIDLEIARLCRCGLSFSPKDIDYRFARLFIDKVNFHRKIFNLGVPQKLLEIFRFQKKDDCQKYLRDLLIEEFDLFLLIHNCGQIGLSHLSKFIQFIPPPFVLNEEDKLHLRRGNVLPFSKKMNGVYSQRKFLHAHFFQENQRWHCFYFTYSDLKESKNHWNYGPHIHYVCHLSNNSESEKFWSSLDERKNKVPGRFHVKFSPFIFPEFHNSSPQKTNPKVVFKNASSNIYDEDYAILHRNEPTPIAQLTVRGSWTSKVVIPFII